ncbi:MAG: RHS repeat-associated core domain-containing protein [Paludibacter sp.]
MGRFLSPDPYVQSPDFTQNFNRYSYCLNNPLKYTDESGELTWNDVIAGVSLVGGVVLAFVVPPLAYIWTPMIVAGFSHFAYTIDLMQNANDPGYKTLSWNDASNIAGFQFSTTIDINRPTVNEKKSAKSNNSYIRNKDAENTVFFQGNYYDASQLLTYLSKENNSEMMMYQTENGYYFENPNGYVFGDMSKHSNVLNVKYSYWGTRENGTSIYYVESTINGTYPFGIKQKGNNLSLNLGMNQNFKVSGVYHTHPGNTILSFDDAFQNLNIDVRAIGWDGRSRFNYQYYGGSIPLNEIIISGRIKK